MRRLPVWYNTIFILAAFMMAGCGEFEFGVETRLTTGRQEAATVVVTATQQIADNMVLVTVTPSAAAETGTPTETPLATETPTASPTATSTETATPTPVAQATSRPSFPTATPVLPQIISFTAVDESVRPGDVVTVNWAAEGQSALLCLRFASGYTDNCYEVSLSGTRTLAIEDFRENIILDLHVSNAAGQESLSSIYITLNCSEDYWFFEDPPESCPIADAVDSYAAAQYFENGWMLWLEETDTIYAFFEPQRTYAVFYSGFGDPDDPAANNDDFEPPDGYFVPKRGFGLVWGMYSYVREFLGWALDVEFGFDTTYQIGADPYNGRLYLLDPDGRLVILNTYSQTWSYR